MKKNIIMMALAGLLLGFSSCNKEIETDTLTAEIAQLDPDTENEGGKNYFYNEHFIYWEDGDVIAVGDQEKNKYTLIDGANTQTAVFYHVNGRISPTKLVAVYPASSWRSDNQLYYPNVMPYRSGDVGGMTPDLTFGKDCFPMVSYLDKGENAVNYHENMTFHSVSGILRIGLFSTKVTGNIDKIEIISFDTLGYPKRQISGEFEIGNLKQYNPYLIAKSSPATDDYKITITGITGRTLGSTSATNLSTFYIPLPAQTEIDANALGSSEVNDENMTKYALQIKVYSGSNVFTKSFVAKIRRNALSKMQVVEIDKWAHVNGQGNVHMVGNGTQLRPFQIYYLNDLIMARDAINSTNGTINGQQITADTYFKVVRSDIQLTDENWTTGIQNFKGHFVCSSGHPTRFGICNNSSTPLFESVSEDGKLDSVTVYGTSSYSGTADFCPLVKVNYGEMRNCVNKVKVEHAQGNLAGVCFTNNGSLNGCRNEADLSTSGQVAGVCFQNNSGNKVRSCVVTGSKLRGSAMGGIVFNNAGDVTNGSAAFNDFGGNCPAGLVVYTNSGTVQNSLCSGHFNNSTSVGGICYQNSGNVIGSRNVMSELAGTTRVGGVVCNMQGGEVRNCYTECAYLDNSGSAAITIGGLVAYVSSGTVANCYVNGAIHPNSSAGNTYVGAVVGQLDGGTFQNSYSTIGSRFYGNVNATANPSYDYCYHFYAASQSGIASLSVSDDGVIKAGSSNLIDLLNDWVDRQEPARFTAWIASSGTNHYPMLTR